MADGADGFETHNFVCSGDIRLRAGKLGVGFFDLGTDAAPIALADAREVLYAQSKATKFCRPGAIYRAEYNPETRSMRTGLKYAEMYADPAMVAAWQAHSKAEEAAHRAAKNEKTESTVDYLAQQLVQLRRMYSKTDAPGKRALEATVLEALRKPLRGNEVEW